MSKSLQKISKKEARSLIYSKLADALSEFKEEKKFEKKLKKASKLFATGAVKISRKEGGKVQRLKKKTEKAPAAVEQAAQ